jgi:pilus assembly protein Flp/PilA
MLNAIRRFMNEEEGASAAEYALLVALISIAMLAAVQLLGGNISTAINTAAGNIAS